MRGDQQQSRAVAVQHLVGLSVEPPAARRPPGLHAPGPPAAGPVAAVVAGQGESGGEGGAGDGEGGGERAGGEAGQQGGALGLGAERGDQGCGEDGGGEQRGGGQETPHLLAGEGEFGRRAADTAVALGEGESGQAELFGEGGPEGGVVPGGGVDGRTQLVGAAAALEQLAEGAADLVLLWGEARVHGLFPPALPSRGPSLQI